MTLDTISGLCQAIDEGDDSLLPILADELEEVGDARAAGVRLMPAGFGPREFGGPYRPVWLHTWARCDESDPLCWSYGFIPHEIYDRLQRGQVLDAQGYNDERGYRSRSSAYLALAEVMSNPGT